MSSLVAPAARVHAAALAALTAGHLGEARRLVAEGAVGEAHPVSRAELVRLRVRLSMWSGSISVKEWLELVEVAEQVADIAPDVAAWMLCDAAVLAAHMRQLEHAEALARRALELTDGRGLAGSLAATGLGVVYGLTGRLEQARPLLARGGELLDADGGIVQAAELLQHSVLALLVQERYDEAVTAAAGFLSAARSLGAVGLLPLPLCLLANAGWKAGRWEEARLAAAEALPLALATQEPTLELYAEAMLALVAGGQGRSDACRERVGRSIRLSESTGVGTFRVTGQMALVHLALGHDRPEEALEPLAEVGRLLQGGRRAGMLNWHADHVDVLVRLGQTARAEQVLQTLAAEAAGSRWEGAAVLRCRGQLDRDDDRAIESLRASVDAFTWQPYEQARSRLRLAQRLAAAGRDGVEDEAAQARHAFGMLRAVAWVSQAEALLTDTPAPTLQKRRSTDQVVLPVVVPPTRTAPAPAAASGVSAPGEVLDQRLEVRLLGGFAVCRSGVPVRLSPGNGVQALKYVALAGGRVSSEELVEALWPGAEPGRGRARLRNVLTRLRRELDVLVRVGNDVALREGCTCDVEHFMTDLQQAVTASGDEALVHARRAVEHYTGELLPGDRFEDWASGPRERLRTRYLQLLDRLAAAAVERDGADEALSWYERAVDVDPYDEDRYVAMARLLVAQGRHGTAHRVLRRAVTVLEKIDLQPSAELTGLLDAVRR